MQHATERFFTATGIGVWVAWLALLVVGIVQHQLARKEWPR